MKKRILGIFIALTFIHAVFTVVSACGATAEKEKVTVSFVQEGRETVVREIDFGSSLNAKDVPLPVDNARYGYTVKWDRTVFKNVTENLVVNAIEVPKTFIVMFDSNGGEAIENGKYAYEQPYTLPVPVRDGYEFKGWLLGAEKLEENGVWTITDNVTVKAEWEKTGE